MITTKVDGLAQIAFLLVAMSLYSTPAAVAQNFRVEEVETTSGILTSFFVDPSGLEANTFSLEVTPTPPLSEFLDFNPTGLVGDITPLTSDDEATFVSAFLDFPADLGGFGLAEVGLSSEAGFNFAVGALGPGNFLPEEEFFVANVLLPAGASGTATLEFFAPLAGVLVASETVVFGAIPEPSGLLIVATCLAGVGVRRRQLR